MSCFIKARVGQQGPSGVTVIGPTGPLPFQNLFSYRYNTEEGTASLPPSGGTLTPFPFDTAIVSNTNFDTGTGILTIGANQVGTYILDVNMQFLFEGVPANNGATVTTEIVVTPSASVSGGFPGLSVIDKPYNGSAITTNMSLTQSVNTIITIIAPCSIEVTVRVSPTINFEGVGAGTTFGPSRFMGRRIS